MKIKETIENNEKMKMSDTIHTKISVKNLSRIYYIILFSAVLVILDMLFFSNWLRLNLPHSPNQVALFTLIFVLPHIICSSIIFFSDKTYISHYKGQLIPGLIVICLLALVAPLFFPQNIILIINGVVTLYHVMGQQFGLTSTIARYKGKYFLWWKYFGLFTSAVIYYLFYFSTTVPPAVLKFLSLFSIVLILIFLGLTFLMNKQITQKAGKAYAWNNFILVLVSFLMIMSGYTFFAMLMTRVIHDLTAFYFYNTHNLNKWYVSSNSNFYSYLRSKNSFKYLMVFLCTPLIAIIFAKGITLWASFTVINCLTLFHYWTESFTWKNGTPHRMHIAME